MFIVYEVGLDLVRTLRPIAESIKLHDRELFDQITRAGTSVLLNIGEANGRSGKDRKRYFQYAKGSVREIGAALDVAEVWGWSVDTEAARSLVVRVDSLLWGMIR